MLLAFALLLQDPDPKRVDAAVADGVNYLKRLKEQKGDPKTDELVLLTFIVAGVPPDDPTFAAILGRVLAAPLQETYKVSLQAMALEKLDPRKHQLRLFECAQFLADTQCRNGQWSYGGAFVPVQGLTAAGRRPAAKLVVVPRGQGGAAGDHSNSQYAALGIRACHDAGMVFPKAFIERARQAWIDGQQKADPKRVATGGAPPRGWGYKLHHADATGSMTAGGVGAVAIYDLMLGIDWKRDPSALSGLAWLAAHFTVAANPERADGDWHHYYLYGLERAGSLFGTEKIGAHAWYRDGAKQLLDSQHAAGSWRDERNDGNGWGESLRDTCFAILFLRRATKPLVDVASVDRFRAPKK